MKTRRKPVNNPPAEVRWEGPSLVPFLPATPYPHCLPEMVRMLEEIEHNEQFVVTQHVRQQIQQEVRAEFQQVLQEKDHHILDLQHQLRRARQDLATMQHLLCSHNKILSYSQGVNATATSPQGKLSLR